MNDPFPHGSRPRVVITGAAFGVGRACAVEFARLGAELVLCDHEGPALRQVAGATGALARFCDIGSESSVDILAAELLDAFPQLHMLINAAGSGYVRSLGVMRVSRALIPALRRTPGQKMIVNVAPQPGLFHPSGLFPYAGSDSAFARLSEAVALQTRGSSIRTATVVPGVGTARLAGHWRGENPLEADTILLETVEPTDIAATIAGLAGDCLGFGSNICAEARAQRRASGC